jgi:hypothetical protein
MKFMCFPEECCWTYSVLMYFLTTYLQTRKHSDNYDYGATPFLNPLIDTLLQYLIILLMFI